MTGLTTLGTVHTAIGVAALVAGAIALAKDKRISTRSRFGVFYLMATLITAATSLGIYQHGGFGVPHALGLLTIAALAIGTLAARSALFGARAAYVETISYSSTFLFHLIPAVTETSTRLPAGAPLLTSGDAPILKVVYLLLLGACAVGTWLQIKVLKSAGSTQANSMPLA